MRLIIVIDGDPDFLKEIGRDLSGLRHRVVATRSPSKGLQMCRTGNPDLILVDIDVPGMPVRAFMDELRQDEITRRIPVIMTVKNVDRETLIAARRAGANDFLLKPYDKDVLLEKMELAWNVGATRTERAPRSGSDAPSALKLTRSGNRLALFIPPELDQEYVDLVREEYTGGMFRLTDGGDLILDLRPLTELSALSRKLLLEFVEIFEDANPLIVAGRQYGILLQEGYDEKARLFLSVEELAAYLNYVGKA